ncbi:MAG: hypothetical protein WCB68_14845 [Pyrinomonadaceae bacterium]
MQKINFRVILAPRNRGILLDVAIFLVSLVLMRAVTMLSMNLVRQAEEDVSAKVALGLFFAGLLLLQPLGPILKRWSFHQRTKFSTDSIAGCLVFCYMFFYIVIMMLISLMASLNFLEAFRDSSLEGISIIVLLVGIVLSFVNAVIIFRYFLKPKKEPRWKFLTTPQAEWLGDLCMFLNVICFQILWSSYIASAIFWELLNTNVHGKPPDFFFGIFLRFFAVAIIALLIYFPPRIFYLVIDRHRKIIWLTMLLANLPLILGVVFFTPDAARARQESTVAASASQTKKILAIPSFTVTAEDFYNEYKLDSQAGARKYEGKYVNVTGRVAALDLKKFRSLGYGLRLDGGGKLQWVYCRFDDDQLAEMQTLKVNQRVTLQGVGEDFWISGPALKHCLLVSAE